MTEINKEEQSFYIINAEVRGNIWCRVPTVDVQRAIEKQQNLYLVDIYHKGIASTYSFFEIAEYKNLDPLIYPEIYLDFVKEEVLVLPTIINHALFKCHYNWVNLLYKYFTSNEFSTYLISVIEADKDKPIYPISVNRFNIFTSNPYNLRGVILSEYSYNNEYNSGYALGTYMKDKPKTLEAIEAVLAKDQGLGWKLRNDCIHLQTQGIFLWNKEFIHGMFNQKFFNAIFEVLNTLPLTWMLLGSGVWDIAETLNTKEIVLEQHPYELLIKKQLYQVEGWSIFGDKLKIKW